MTTAKNNTIIPAMRNLDLNAEILSSEYEWFAMVLDVRFKNYFGQEGAAYETIYDVPVPDLTYSEAPYANVVKAFNLSFEERLILLLALSPHVCPQALDILFVRNTNTGRGYAEFGGISGQQHSGFLPTGETAAFLLSANNLNKRFEVLKCFDPEHFFAKKNILRLEKDKSNEPLLSGALTITREYLTILTLGEDYKPTFSNEFPAHRLYTNLEWEDLVLDELILEEINEIMAWLKYQDQIMKDWGLGKRIKPGYRTLFYGPPGTGKTLVASLLGKTTKKEVYRVDLSKIVSKYIGETEKNLAGIFDQAENKNWILFFDEADALFGKRTATKDSKDRHANQEVAYLLQRIEEFPGIVVLATNLKTNLDEAFARRFQSMIYFPMPRPEQRFQLWKKAFEGCNLEEVDLWKIAQEYEMAGGAIINILRYCALLAAQRAGNLIYQEDIEYGIRKEFRKEGKTI